MDRPWLALIVALAALPGCRRETTFATRELPGFSLSLPTGRTVGTPKLDYATGSLAVAADSPVEVALVGWSAGTKLTTEELQAMLQAFGGLVHTPVPGTVTTEPGPGGKPVETMRLATDAVPLLVTQMECGGRYVMLCTGRESGGNAFHRRVLMSFQCKPDPAGEATLHDASVELELELPDWYAASREDNQLQLTDGRSLLMLQPMATMASDKLLQAIGPVLTAAFHGTVTADAPVGDRVILHGAVEGETVVGWAKLVTCPKSKTLALALASDQETADTLHRAVAKAKCLAPGAPRQKWPDAPNPAQQ